MMIGWPMRCWLRMLKSTGLAQGRRRAGPQAVCGHVRLRGTRNRVSARTSYQASNAATVRLISIKRLTQLVCGEHEVRGN